MALVVGGLVFLTFSFSIFIAYRILEPLMKEEEINFDEENVERQYDLKLIKFKISQEGSSISIENVYEFKVVSF